MMSNASIIGIISDIEAVVQMGNGGFSLRCGERKAAVKTGAPGVKRRKAKRKAKKMARRVSRKK